MRTARLFTILGTYIVCLSTSPPNKARSLVVFYGFQFRSSPFWVVVVGVTAANVISTVVGFLVLGFWPNPERAPNWLVYPIFFVAWGLSVGIEYGVYRSVLQWRRWAKSKALSCILILGALVAGARSSGTVR